VGEAAGRPYPTERKFVGEAAGRPYPTERKFVGEAAGRPAVSVNVVLFGAIHDNTPLQIPMQAQVGFATHGGGVETQW